MVRKQLNTQERKQVTLETKKKKKKEREANEKTEIC